ncbi:MAG TPA: hypothetical protein VGE74_26620, partial [Gemmata sp.]
DRPQWVYEGYGVFGSRAARTTGTGYDAAGNVAWTTDGNGVKTAYVHDALDRLVAVTEAAGDPALQRTTFYEYDKVGRVTWEWAPREFGHESLADALFPSWYRVGTKHEYDDGARTEKVTEAASVPGALGLPPLNHTATGTITRRDLLGRVDLVTDPLGRSTRYVYDDLGRQVGILGNWFEAFPGAAPVDQPHSNAVLATYDAANNLRKQETAGAGSEAGGSGWQSVTDRYTYDVLNRLTKTERAVDSTGFKIATNGPVVTRTQYDALDRVLWSYDPNGNGTGYEYTPFDEVKRVLEGGGYFAIPFVAQEDTPPTGYMRSTDFTYDGAGRLLTTTQDRFTTGQPGDGGPARVTTGYGYDVLGRRTSVTEAQGTSLQRTTWFTYDGNDRLLATIEPLLVIGTRTETLGGFSFPVPVVMNRTTRNTYDALGRLVSVTEADGLPGWSRTTSMGYDAADNLVWTAAPRRYDFALPSSAAVPAVSAADAVLTVNRYDALNRRTQTTEAANATTNDLAGYASPVTEWRYDEAGRVRFVIGPADASDPTTRRAVEYIYDTRDQVTHRTDLRWGVATNAPAVLLRQDTFAYDGFGHVQREVDGHSLGGNAGEQNLAQTDFTYDALGRLRETAEKIDASYSRVTYSDYDAVGNVVLQAVARSDVPNLRDALLQDVLKFYETRRTGYTYDRLNRVAAVTAAWAPEAGKVFKNTNQEYQQAVRFSLGHDSPVTKYEYNAQDQVIAVTDPRGVRSATDYDPLGRKVAVREAESWFDPVAQKYVPIMTASASGLDLTGFTVPQQTWSYDPADRLTATTVGGLRLVDSTKQDVVTKYEYDPLDRQTLMVEAWGTPRERRTITAFDTADNRVRVTSGVSLAPAVQTVTGQQFGANAPVATQFVYDALGRVREVTEGANQSDDQLLFETGHSRPRTSYTYDASGNVVLIETDLTRPKVFGQSVVRDVSYTRRSYDRLGRLTRVVAGEGPERDTSAARVTSVVYDSTDHPVRELKPGEPARDYRYDALGRRTREVVGAGLTGQGTRGAYGKDISQTTTTEYNVFDQVVTSDPPLGETTTWYDLLGRVSQVDPNSGRQIRYQYDAAGNTLSVTDITARSWFIPDAKAKGGFQTDTDGRKIVDSGGLASNPREARTEYVRDPLGRPTQVIDPNKDESGNNYRTTYRYDPLGRVELIGDRNGKQRYFGYDELGRVVQEYWVSDGKVESVIVSYYDALDNERSSFAAALDKYTFADDATGRGTRPVPAADAMWTVDPLTLTKSTYNSLGRLWSVASPAGIDLTYVYDAGGRVTGIEDDHGGGQSTVYDRAGRVVVLSLTDDRQQATEVRYLYQPARVGLTDQRKQLTLIASGPSRPSGAVVGYGTMKPDEFGAEYARGWFLPGDPKPVLKEQVTSYFNADGTVSRDSRSSDKGLTSSDVSYTYDAFGLGHVKETRTTIAGNTTWTNNYPDASGNPPALSQGEAENQNAFRMAKLVGVDNLSYSVRYDGEGNVTEITANTPTAPNAPTLLMVDSWVFSYDYRNRLVSVVQWQRPGSGGTWVETRETRYLYDTHDQLVRTETWQPVGDAWQVVDRTDTVYDRGHVYADLRMAGPVDVRYLYDPAGAPLARLSSRGPLFYFTDRQNSVLQVIDAAGTAVKRIRYEGLREARVLGEAGADRLGLNGQPYDRNTRLQSLNGWWFASLFGRFLGEGGSTAGLNPYPVPQNEVSFPRVTRSWEQNMKPTGHEFFERLGQQVSQGLGFRSDEGGKEGGKIVAGLWGMAYGFTPPGLAENLLPRDLATGQLQVPGDWGSKTTNRMAHGVRLNFDGYRARGSDRVEAVILTALTNTPILGAEVKRWEMITRTSFQGTTFGDKLTASDYVLNTVSIGVDVAGTVMGGVGVLGRIGGAAGRTGAAVTRLGRVASGLRTGIEAASVVTGIPSPWGLAASVRWPLQRPLNMVVHGWMKGSRYHARTADVLNALGFRVCFVGGTPIQGEHGAKPIELFQSYEEHGDNCDLVVSRDEHNRDGALTLRRVLRVFRRIGPVFHLTLPGGIVIGTTGEHPFFVRDKGWTAAQELRPG